MTIHVANRHEGEDLAPLEPVIKRVGEAVLQAEGAGHLEVSVAVVSDDEIHALNRDYLGHDYPTDVVTFLLREEGDPDLLLGEVVVSADHAREEAAARTISFEEELCRYVCHGCLHLLGYDDHDEAERTRMHARQEELLRLALAHRPAI